MKRRRENEQKKELLYISSIERNRGAFDHELQKRHFSTIDSLEQTN